MQHFEKLEFKSMGLKYPSHSSPLFEDVTIKMPMNSVVLLQGQRGTGKSSLLEVLAGLQMPTMGEYLINNEPVSEMSFDEFLPFRKRIGYSFDYGGLLNNRTIFENMILPLLYHHETLQDEAEARVISLLKAFNLENVSHLRPPDISGGRRKEVCVARAFVMDPEMVILDDPTMGLSAPNKITLVNLIRQKRQEGRLKHVFFASEDLRFTSELVEKVMTLRQGKIMYFDLDSSEETG